MDNLEIEYVDISDIKPYEHNAKLHPREQVEQIKRSIKDYKMCDPIGIWHNEVVEGHGRLLACKELGFEKVPVIRLDHLTDEQRKEYILVHNKTTMNSDFDEDMLRLELDDLTDFDAEFYDFDFDLDDLDEELDEVEDEESEAINEDAPKITQLGDMWELGNHRLVCGDMLDADNVKALAGGEPVDMIFTDPPYGMNLDTDYSSMKNNLDFATSKHFTGGKKYEQGKVDEFSPDMIKAVLDIKAKEVFLWGADYFAELLPNKNDGSWIVWDKRANGNDDIEQDESSDKMYGSCFELCWSKKKHKRDIARIKWAGVFGTEKEFDHRRYHPTQKPSKLAQWFLERYSNIGDTILDLFGGSGSTLIACEQLDRKCYMCELDTHYCDVIVERYINLVGGTEDVYLLRDDRKIPYSEIAEKVG